MPTKNAHAVAIGRRGGQANSPAQRAWRANSKAGAGRPLLYRLVGSSLQKRLGDSWLELEPPYDAAAKAFLRRSAAR